MRGFPDWASNFYPSWITVGGVRFPTVEHAYQAAKSEDPAVQQRIRLAETPGEAKRRGRLVFPLRPHWGTLRDRVMLRLLQVKFEPGTELAHRLVAHDGELVEWNNWHDVYWGKCICSAHKEAGDNKLGRTLIEVRDWVLSQ